MNFFKKLLQPLDTVLPDKKFGRFSDSYKEEEKYRAWDKSLEAFEKKSYLECFRFFLEYLQNEEANLSFVDTESEIEFELYQGSKKITGKVNSNKISAEAKVAVIEDMNIGFLRKLIEQNFNLKYAKYALTINNEIALVFNSYMLDASPYKLYYALKELSVNADKQDDILIEEFNSLSPINTGHIKSIGDEEKNLKYDFLVTELEKLFNTIEHGSLDQVKYPGGISYIILSMIYKLDFLIRPEGSTMESFEKIHKLFFVKDGKRADRKNFQMLKEIEKVKSRDKDSFLAELYNVKSTFGITAPTSKERIVELIDDELANIDWYIVNKHSIAALAIPGFVVGYSLFNYALPLPIKELFKLYYAIFNKSYFEKLGYPNDYLNKDSTLNKRKIISAIKSIFERLKPTFPRLALDSKVLDFRSHETFCKSYLIMIKQLDTTKL